MKLFPSTLLISKNLDPLLPALSELGHTLNSNNPDIFFINILTIETIRQINHFLSQKPYNHRSKIIIIENADLLNIESQNALLKNLEEPGEGNYFILQTLRPAALLDTITSRCHTIRHHDPAAALTPRLQFPENISACLSLVDNLGLTKDTLIPYLESQIRSYQQELIHNPTVYHQQRIQKLLKAVSMSRANVDPKSVMDFLLLS